MVRRLLAGLFATGLAIAVGFAADDKKKEPPKKKERIAIADPQKAKADPDFLIQGEYVGEVTLNEGKKKVGAQVVAKGNGLFDVKVLFGGLPGEGWDAKSAVLKGTAMRSTDGAIALTGQHFSGSIASGKMTIKDGMKIESVLVRVERKSKTLGEKPPSGAVVLFGGPGDEKKWNGGKLVELSDGTFLGVGETSKPALGAFKAHIEFRTPWMPNSSGQGRGNSGVYLQDRYECQVLDSFGLNGENNECGGFYTQHKPLVNMCLPPLSWQTYDIEFTPAVFDASGKKTKNARATVHHNGVKIHDNVELPRNSPGGKGEDAKPGPFQFQNHGDPVVYNNVWVVEVK